MQQRYLIFIRTFVVIAFIPWCLFIHASYVHADDAIDAIDLFDPDAIFNEDAPEIIDQEETVTEKSIWDNLSTNGYLKSEMAYRFDEPRTITKIRNIFSLGAQLPISSQMELTFSGWFYYDLAYDLFDYETIAARFVRDQDQPLVFVDNLDQQKDDRGADIREFYLDIFTDKVDIRLGKQFVIWGVLDGMRITDEINPLDFRELILPDLLDYRIPLWTLKIDYYAEASSYQFLWIPDIKFHKPAPRGSEWELLQDVPNSIEPDNRSFRNTEVGFKASKDIADTEFALSYFYTWDDFPVIFRKAQIDSLTEPTFFPSYTRLTMYGGTFIKPIGEKILKGEFVYVPDKYFGLRNDVDNDNDGFLDHEGELQKKHVRWGLGLDFNVWTTDFSVALAQWIIFDYEDGLLQDKFDTSLALFLRKPMPHISTIFQLLAIQLINLKELYLKPKFIFELSDKFQMAVGLDLFYGRKSKLGVSASGGAVSGLNTVEQSAQFIGNFNDNDRIFMEIKYTF